MSDPSLLADDGTGVQAVPGTAPVLSLEQAVANTQLQQFRHWWLSAFSRRRAGPAVSRMWNDYPFGALIVDESWAWWSLARVTGQGQLEASEVGHPLGVVLASAAHGVAVLDWPDDAEGISRIELVPYRAVKARSSGGGEGRATLSPERFLSAKGFDKLEAVVPCAFCEYQPKSLNLATLLPATAAASRELSASPAALDPAYYRSRRTGTASASAPRAHLPRVASRAHA